MTPRTYVLPLLWVLLVAGCGSSRTVQPDARLAAIEAQISELQRTYAPDRRTARFDVRLVREEGRARLTGETDQPEALQVLEDYVRATHPDLPRSISLWPDTALGARHWALAAVAVANLRAEPRHSSELVTQVLMGTPLRVKTRQGSWFLVQTPESYLGWVDGGGMQRFSREELDARRQRPHLVVLLPQVPLLEEPREDAAIVGDLALGGKVAHLEGGSPAGWHAVEVPGGQRGFVQSHTVAPFEAWAQGLRVEPEGVVQTALQFRGVPYLWGGTSVRGFDCSGFTKTVYLMHGLILPRDASQQIREGITVDASRQWERLIPGDLLFFGVPATDGRAERVIHVGLWIGNNRFIHASGQVRINSVDPVDPDFDAFEVGRYLRTQRLVPEALPRVHQDGLYVRFNTVP